MKQKDRNGLPLSGFLAEELADKEVRMTMHELFRRQLGKKAFAHLSKEWKDHLRRVDSLPRPIKNATRQMPAR